MAETMVVARVAPEKKERVAQRLAMLGLNASAAINALYDYIDKTGQLPEGLLAADDHREDRRTEAIEWLGGIRRLPRDNAFAIAGDEDIKAARLRSQGFRV